MTSVLTEKGKTMSVSREVIANVVGIDADDVRCENCEAMPTFMVCKTWDTLMGVGEFCSLFRPKGERKDNEID